MNATFFEASGRGVVSRKRAAEALHDRIGAGAAVATDKPAVYIDVLNDLKVASLEATTPKTARRVPSTASTPSIRSSIRPWCASKVCPPSTSTPISTGSAGAAPSWRPTPAARSPRSHVSSPTEPARSASVTCSTSCRPIWTTGSRGRRSPLKWWHRGIHER